MGSKNNVSNVSALKRGSEQSLTNITDSVSGMNLKNEETEEDIQERIKAREIVQTILQHGVSQEQIKQIIYLLSLEVEDPKIFRGVSSLISQHKPKNVSKILGGE